MRRPIRRLWHHQVGHDGGLGRGGREGREKRSESSFILNTGPTGFPDSWWMEEKGESRMTPSFWPRRWEGWSCRQLWVEQNSVLSRGV